MDSFFVFGVPFRDLAELVIFIIKNPFYIFGYLLEPIIEIW
jgi:hypothetical protein